MAQFTVIGCGAWGCTMAGILADNGHGVTLWCHDSTLAKAFNDSHQHTVFTEIHMPDTIQATTELQSAVAQSDALICALASDYIQLLATLQLTGQPLLLLTKGLLDVPGYKLISDYAAALWGDAYPMAILSGPNLAYEIACGHPAAAVVACQDETVAERWQNWISNAVFRTYRTTDLIGVQLGGIVKNVIAIAAGALDGLGLGDNARAALITRGLQEMMRFGRALGARDTTFFGLSGLGDLIATCSSSKSRNYTVGYRLGQGESLAAIRAGMTAVAEGVKAARLVMALAREHQIDMPISESVEAVLLAQKTPKQAIMALMTRELKPEQ